MYNKYFKTASFLKKCKYSEFKGNYLAKLFFIFSQRPRSEGQLKILPANILSTSQAIRADEKETTVSVTNTKQSYYYTYLRDFDMRHEL